MADIIDFDRRRPDTAVDRLNRQTGLDFREWPESLVNRDHEGTRGRNPAGTRADMASQHRQAFRSSR